MIELRWVRRRKVKSGMVSTSKVLQSRSFQLGTDASGALTPAGSPGWSAWKDVPIVDEGSDDISRST